MNTKIITLRIRYKRELDLMILKQFLNDPRNGYVYEIEEVESGNS